MKLDPGFPNHWKTERLVAELGAEGVIALLRLWCNAQIRRQFDSLPLNAHRLAMETKWKGDENHLFSVFTDPDAPWLDKNADGTYSIHGFSDHQAQVVALWENGKKGGRPRKVSSSDKSEEGTSSSSSPIRFPNGLESKPNGNQMVSESKPLCTLDQAKSHAPMSGLTDKEAEFWWNSRNSAGWTKGTANGGAPRKITSWQSDMATSIEWVKANAGKNGKKEWKPNL